MRLDISLLLIPALTLTSCVAHVDDDELDDAAPLFALLSGGSRSPSPTLHALEIVPDATTESSIDLARPTFANQGTPVASASAYIGINGKISVEGDIVHGATEGPVDVTSAGYHFANLKSDTLYRIIVIGTNASGYFVSQIMQRTGPLAPTLLPLTISSSTIDSITLIKPTFSRAGNPSPEVVGYVGINGRIKVTGTTVGDSIQGPIDLTQGGTTFSNLNADTVYRIIVVARNVKGYSIKQITQRTSGIAPVLNPLEIGASDARTITLQQPTFATPGNPAPTVRAYIGIDGVIQSNGFRVTGALRSANVAAGGYQFPNLKANTTYRIIAVARNRLGYSVQQIIQMTTGNGTAPILRPLEIQTSDSTSITLAPPTFSAAGNPTPVISAYLGVNGQISVSGSVVTGSLSGPINVAQSGHQFTGLNPLTLYRIIVVAKNGPGYSTQQIIQRTGGVAPVLNAIAVNSWDAENIEIARPTFAAPGNPDPIVRAYIGIDGIISLQGSSVSGNLDEPADVSLGGYQFTGLQGNTSYRIIVVAQNESGYSTAQIVQHTAGVAPVLNALSINSTDASSISLNTPTFATVGNPAPSVTAYLGINGTIAANGAQVSGYSQGPINVTTSGVQFASLNPNTTYQIIVVAQNDVGYFVQQITQSTSGVAPVLDNLNVSATDTSSVTIAQPTFLTVGNPLASVQAFIGFDGQISVNGGNVQNALQGPVDVSLGGHQFASLIPGTAYRVIVVAQNSVGISVQDITQSTAGIAPVLNPLRVLASDQTSVTLAQPTFANAGNPTPTVLAYIGETGTISVSGSSVSGASEGPVNVATGGYQFGGLQNIPYTIIVVSANRAGYSIMQYGVAMGSAGSVYTAIGQNTCSAGYAVAFTGTMYYPVAMYSSPYWMGSAFCGDPGLRFANYTSLGIPFSQRFSTPLVCAVCVR